MVEAVERSKHLLERDGPPMPATLFDFEDVLQAAALVEGAVQRHSEAKRAEGEERYRGMAADPSRSFLKELPFTKMALDSWKTDFVFPAILRGSLLVAVCSHTEGVLKLWCRGLEENWKLVSGWKKRPNERASDASLRYLAEVAGLVMPTVGAWPEVAKLNAYWDVRNFIVHSASVVDKELDVGPIADFVEVDDSQLVSPYDRVIHVGPGACEDAARAAKGLLDRIGEAFLVRAQEREKGPAPGAPDSPPPTGPS